MMFGEAAKNLGYHPFPSPVAIASIAYQNSEGIALGACEYCGYCNRMACETNAKASANTTVMPVLGSEPKFELRTQAYVTRLIYDKAARKVTGVLYTDTRTGAEYEQPAGIVVLSSFVFGNTQQLLLAGIGDPYDPVTGRGLVGKNYAYQFEAGAEAFFENVELNPFMGNAGTSMSIDDFNGENFDHAGIGLLWRRLHHL
jgi:gluconate 2-dehydrogenase alpha chain